MTLRERLIAPLNRLERTLELDLRYLIKGNIWITLQQVVANAAGVTLTILFANLLTPDSYGFFKYVISLAGIFGAFSLTGIGTALINSIARGDYGVIRATFWPTVLWNFIPSSLALIVALYYLLHSNLALTISLLVFAVFNPWNAGFGNYRHYFTGTKDFFHGALYGMSSSIVPIFFIAAAVILTQNPVWVVFAYFFGNTLVAATLYFMVTRTYHLPETADSAASTLRFAKQSSVLSVFLQIGSQIDQFLVWHFLGSAAVAQYSLATSPVEQLQTLTGSTFTLVAPKFATKDAAELRRIVPIRIKQMLLLVIPIVIGYILLAPLLFKYVFPKYLSVVFYTQVYALLLLLKPLGFIDAAFVAQQNTGARAKILAFDQAVKIVLLALGIWKYGIWGGILALIISGLFNTLVSLLVFFYTKPQTS